MSAPVPATRAGRCDCCSTPYRAGTPIVWDTVVSGWVLAGHRSAARAYVNGIRQAGSGKDLFYFEIPLRNATL